jgi:hypothetical protein
MGALGQRQQPQTAPAEYQPLEPGNARQQLQQERQRSKPAPQGPTSSAEPTPDEFRGALEHYADQEGLNADAVAQVIHRESGGKPGITNPETNKHAGLIQFSQETWKRMDTGMTWEQMRKLSAEEQLPYVMQYFRGVGLGPDDDVGQYALGAFWPVGLNEPDEYEIGRKGSKKMLHGKSMGKIWEQNRGYRDGDVITAGSVRRKARGGV